MSPRLSLRLAAALWLGAAALPRPVLALEAAAAKVDITPDLKTEKTLMAGFGATGRKPLGVHDPLFARIAVPPVIQSVILEAVAGDLGRDIGPVEIIGPILRLGRPGSPERDHRQGQRRRLDP